MTGPGASKPDAQTSLLAAHHALNSVSDRRSSVDAPLDYSHRIRHPWTRDFNLQLVRAIHTQCKPEPNGPIHEVASRWWGDTTHDLKQVNPDNAIRVMADSPYATSWRIYAADDSQMIAQPLVAELSWRGQWSALSRACDRLAQARCTVRLLVTQADPNRDVGSFTLAQACAYRIAAFAPAGQSVLLAFYCPDGGWREQAGFSYYGYRTGAQELKPLSL